MRGKFSRYMKITVANGVVREEQITYIVNVRYELETAFFKHIKKLKAEY